jgi:hypothetical protein
VVADGSAQALAAPAESTKRSIVSKRPARDGDNVASPSEIKDTFRRTAAVEIGGMPAVNCLRDAARPHCRSAEADGVPTPNRLARPEHPRCSVMDSISCMFYCRTTMYQVDTEVMKFIKFALWY